MNDLAAKLAQLKLAFLSRQLQTLLADAASKNLSLAASLEWLADLELEQRRQHAIQRRFHLSRLQTQPTIEQFHFQHHKSRMQVKTRLLRLFDLDFIAQGTNVILIGNPGTGKTFLAKILGWRGRGVT
jgi:DNA replication protein DnaC